MRERILIQGSLIRVAYGVGSLLFPKVLFASIGMKEIDPEARYLNRLFGGRDLVIAGLTVDAARRGNGVSAAVTNLLCEATDTVGLVEEVRARGKLERALIVGLVFNVLGYATWIRALLAPAKTASAATEAAPAAVAQAT
jgi:hypothetical protein